MNFKALYQRFRAWQIEPYQFKCESESSHQCANCGNQYKGDFCPVCGQSYHIGPMGSIPSNLTSSLLENIMAPDTLISYILQLVGRPGYLIGDYISGRQQVCGNPMSMLCYVGLVAMFVLNHVGNANAIILSTDGDFGVLVTCLEWMTSNLYWAILIQTILLILPTWLLFRNAPKHTHHTLKEGFYIQLFMSPLVLIIIMLRAVVGNWLIFLNPLVYFIAYRQLFGYGIWGTLWRTLLCIGIISYIFGVNMMTVKYLQGDFSTHYSNTAIAMAIAMLAIGIGVVVLGWWIGKKTASKAANPTLEPK